MCNFNRLMKRMGSLKSFLFDPEPSLTFNGSTVSFKATGDLTISAGRHLISDYRLSFAKSDPLFIAQSVGAYAQGEKSYQRFMIATELRALHSEANALLEKLVDDLKPNASEKLGLLNVEIALLLNSVDQARNEDEDVQRMVMNRAVGIRQMLIGFLQNPKAFEPRVEKTQEQLLKEAVEKSMPGLTVMRVEKELEPALLESLRAQQNEGRVVPLEPKESEPEHLEVSVVS